MSNMKLCKVCQKEIAKSAKVCPNCGAKQGMGVLKKLGIGLGILIVLIIIISVASANGSSSSSSQADSTSSSSSKSEKSSKQEWNKTDTDIQKNGNIDYAVSLIKKDNNLKSKVMSAEPAEVAKAPYKYYGQVIKAAGTVNDVQDYAAGSDWSKTLGGGEAAQIVITTDNNDATIDMFVVGSSTGDLKKGDYVTLYGYPIGLTDNANSSGGKDTELAIVGNSYEKASDSTD